VLTIITSLFFGFAVGAVFRLALVHSLAAAIAPAIIAVIAAMILIMRRVGKQVQPVVEEAQRHLQGGRRELALKSLKQALGFQRWHPLLAGQIHAQIGALHYANADYDEAITELERASARPWEAKAFLGCAYFKKHDEKGLKKAFDIAVRVGKKESLVWTLYAYCMNARGRKDEAAAILQRGLKENAGDQRLQNNLELVQQGKKLKVAPYGERWAGFGLDGSTPNAPKGMKGYTQRPGFRPGFRQKPMRGR
jgi:tetratricopeptide (TPR) repeat protein